MRISLNDPDGAGCAGSTGLAVRSASTSAAANLAVKQNVAPPPGLFSAQIRPFISSTRRFEMARPRPVPPYSRVVDASACVKASKIESSFSAGIPMPLSETEKRRTPGWESSRSGSTRTTTCPAAPNLMALPTRLIRICRNRSGSPLSRAGVSGATS